MLAVFVFSSSEEGKRAASLDEFYEFECWCALILCRWPCLRPTMPLKTVISPLGGSLSEKLNEVTTRAGACGTSR